jgi:hypothetical protein
MIILKGAISLPISYLVRLHMFLLQSCSISLFLCLIFFNFIDLKLGISEKSIFDEFHPDAQDLFNVTCDLKFVCEKLNDRSQRHKRQVMVLNLFYWTFFPWPTLNAQHHNPWKIICCQKLFSPTVLRLHIFLDVSIWIFVVMYHSWLLLFCCIAAVVLIDMIYLFIGTPCLLLHDAFFHTTRI